MDPPEAPAEWLRARRDWTLRAVEALVHREVASPDARALLGLALARLHPYAVAHPFCPFVHLPWLAYADRAGDDPRVLPVTVATTLLYLGIDLLDDLADGDLDDTWRGYRPAEVQLIASGLIGPLPQLALAELDAPAETIVALQRHLARGLVRVGAGQHLDLRAAGRAGVSLAEVEASVIGKSGEEFALFAGLGARLAGADEPTVEGYAELGRVLGTAVQFASDADDLFSASESRDLKNGTRSLPIVLQLASLPENAERACFLARLDRARDAPSARAEVRQTLRANGIAWTTGLVVDLYRQRAREAEARLAPRAETRARFQLALDGFGGAATSQRRVELGAARRAGRAPRERDPEADAP